MRLFYIKRQGKKASKNKRRASAGRNKLDIVVDFGPQQFILELKLWDGKAHQADAYAQLDGYLEGKGADTGYLLTFDFRKDGNKAQKAEWVEFNGRRIFDVVV